MIFIYFCSKVVSSLYQDARINEATVILDKMVDFDLLTVHNKCTDNSVKNNTTLVAQKIVDSLDKNAIHNSLPNNIVYNIAIDGLCKSGKINEARSVLSVLISRGFLPDNFSINSCLFSFWQYGRSFQGNIDRAQRLFHKLHQKWLVPNAATCNINQLLL